MRDPNRLLCLAALLFLPRLLEAQDQDTRIGNRLSISVVAIRNPEGYGSGMILDEKGLILTNAHVVCSPLPFVVEAMGSVGKETKLLSFKKVSLLGVHPEYDLALLQIDPSEHRATIKPVTICKSSVASGDPLWAMGYPSDVEGGRKKILTTGKVLSTTRIFQSDPYIEMDVSLFFGNSGGPVCDGSGEIIGVATAIAQNGHTLAVPIASVRPERFVPLRQRSPNHGISTSFIAEAEKHLDALSKGRGGSLAMAIELYEMALVYDSGNAALYAKIGQFNFHTKRYNFAIAYYIRSIQMQSWPDQGPLVYRQLGLSFAHSKKSDDAITTWKEGLRKFPIDNSLLWDELAIIMMQQDSPFEAACAARTALKCFSDNPDVMNEIYKKARNKMGPEEMGKLRSYEGGLDALLTERRIDAEKARKEGKEFMTPEMQKLIGSFSGVQQSGTIDMNKLGLKREIEKLDVSDEELTRLFLRSRVDAAGENLRAGRLDLAAQTLEDVIKTYPNHAETEVARELLEIIRKKQKK